MDREWEAASRDASAENTTYVMSVYREPNEQGPYEGWKIERAVYDPATFETTTTFARSIDIGGASDAAWADRTNLTYQ